MATLSSRLTPLTVSVPAMSEWTSYTPTLSWTNTTQTGRWRRVGDSIQIMVDIAFTGAPSTVGTISTSAILPSSLTIDNAKFPNTSDVALAVGTWHGLDSGVSGSFGGYVQYDGASVLVCCFSTGASTASGISTTAPFTWGSADNLSFNVTLPISGWTSHTASATSANAVVVGGQSVGNTMNFGATSNQGFNILANNVAAIASTAAGALTLGLPSAIGGSTYAGQAIVGKTNSGAISAGYVGESRTTTGNYVGATTAGTTLCTMSSVTPGIYLVYFSAASVYSSGSVSTLEWSARFTSNVSLNPATTDFYTNVSDTAGGGSNGSVSTVHLEISSSRVLYLQVTATTTYYLRASVGAGGGGSIGLNGSLNFVRIA